MMLGNTTPSSLLCTASCFADYKDHHTTSTEDIDGDTMKQPLIGLTRESLKDEEQATLSQERPCRSILCIQSFLLGTFITFALQGIAFASCRTLVHIYGKKLQEPHLSRSLASEPEAAIFVIVFSIVYTLILYTFLHMRKKFEKEDGTASNPSSGFSLWTERKVDIIGVYFTVGAFVGSSFLWKVVFFMSTGMGLPWSPYLSTMVICWVLLLITVECFEWRRSHNWDHTTSRDHELARVI
jgi:hypothetical protein